MGNGATGSFPKTKSLVADACRFFAPGEKASKTNWREKRFARGRFNNTYCFWDR